MQVAIERAIATMWDRYHEELTIEELADVAILSRFYFSRIFRTATGTSPGRFLTAVRLCEAKKMLLATTLSVSDICYQVGYNSLGTFTSRFTSSVGLSPARYRYRSAHGLGLTDTSLPLPRERSGGTIHGSLRVPETGVATRLYVGVFESPVAQGHPESLAIVDRAATYRLDEVPDGELFIRAIVVATGDLDPLPWHRRPLFVSEGQSVQVRPGDSIRVDLEVRPTHITDVPVLLALPELDSRRPPQLAMAP